MDFTTGHKIALIAYVACIFGLGRQMLQFGGLKAWVGLAAVVCVVTGILTYAWPLLAKI